MVQIGLSEPHKKRESSILIVMVQVDDFEPHNDITVLKSVAYWFDATRIKYGLEVSTIEKPWGLRVATFRNNRRDSQLGPVELEQHPR